MEATRECLTLCARGWAGSANRSCSFCTAQDYRLVWSFERCLQLCPCNLGSALMICCSLLCAMATYSTPVAKSVPKWLWLRPQKKEIKKNGLWVWVATGAAACNTPVKIMKSRWQVWSGYAPHVPHGHLSPLLLWGFRTSTACAACLCVCVSTHAARHKKSTFCSPYILSFLGCTSE